MIDAVELLERIRAAATGNPFNSQKRPDAHRAWEAASAVSSGPCETLHVAGHLEGGRTNHAAIEGIDR